MNRGPAVLHRITALIIGLLCLAVGVAAVAWQADIGPARDWVDHLDPNWATTATSASWWWAVLLAGTVIAGIWGLWLLGAASRPGRVGSLELAGSGSAGTMSVAPKLVAAAVADDLSRQTIFSRATAKAVDDRGRAIVRIEVTAHPRYSYNEIAEKLAPVVHDLRAALAGADIHVQALVHLENVK